MRIAPVGLFYNEDHEKLYEAAKNATIVTHNTEATIESAVLIAEIIAHSLHGKSADEAVRLANESTSNHVRKIIDYVLDNHKYHPEKIAEKIGASESVFETVPMAVSCFLYTPDDYESTVINAANLAPGDTDSIACIAGAMSG